MYFCNTDWSNKYQRNDKEAFVLYPTFAFRYPIIMMMNNVEITNAVTLNTTMYQFGLSRTITSANRDDDPPIVQSLGYCFSITNTG